MPRARLQQIIQRNKPQKFSGGVLDHRQPRYSSFRHAIYDDTQDFVWICLHCVGSHQISKRTLQDGITFICYPVADISPCQHAHQLAFSIHYRQQPLLNHGRARDRHDAQRGGEIPQLLVVIAIFFVGFWLVADGSIFVSHVSLALPSSLIFSGCCQCVSRAQGGLRSRRPGFLRWCGVR